MTSQKQDLTFFGDNSIVPSNSEHLLSLVTHTQGTSPSWLINALIEDALYGTCQLNHDQKHTKTALKTEVTVISFVHDQKFYQKDLKKSGVELGEGFHFIDLFSDLFSKITGAEALTKVIDGIVEQIKTHRHQHKTVFLEGIEFLLSATNITPAQLLSQITKLQRASTSLFIVASADQQLIDYKVPNPALPEFKTADFLIRLLHRSQLNISLRPLDTGRAKDVTGTLTISKGAIPYKSLPVLEKEYLFLVSRDQQSKLFYR